MPYDLIIRNGKVIDGSGLRAFTATSPSTAVGSSRSAR